MTYNYMGVHMRSGVLIRLIYNIIMARDILILDTDAYDSRTHILTQIIVILIVIGIAYIANIKVKLIQ